MNELFQDSLKPLYIQLRDIIKSKIESGELQSNQKIPNETELIQTYRVSRITVRKAIDELTDEGLVVKKQGKGTFVCKQKYEECITDNMSFSVVCDINGVRPGSRIIVRELRPASLRDMEELKLNKEDKVIYLERLRFADNEPVIYEYNFFLPRFGILLTEDLENRSIYELLKENYNLKDLASSKTIEIGQANDKESKALGIHYGAPILVVREIVSHHGEPVHRTKLLIGGNRFILKIR